MLGIGVLWIIGGITSAAGPGPVDACPLFLQGPPRIAYENGYQPEELQVRREVLETVTIKDQNNSLRDRIAGLMARIHLA